MITDAHLHVWDLDVSAYAWIEDAAYARSFTPCEAEAELAACGVDAAFLLQADDTAADTGALLGLEAPWKAGVVGWLDTHHADATDVRALRADPIVVGIRDGRGTGLLDPEHAWLGDWSDAGLAVDVLDFDVATALATRHPSLRVVVDHLGRALTVDEHDWLAGLRRVAALPNVWLKLSGLGPDPAARAAAVAALDLLGPRRLMYGSNWPVCLAGGGSMRAALELALDLTAELSPHDRRAVLHGTAHDVYQPRGAE